MLTLNDGRSELWQWDTGRTLTVDAECSQVHFSNKVFGRSIDVEVVDGVAIVPDILLQTDKELNVWAFVGTAESGYTKISKKFKVNRRNKPADYVFTPPDQTSLEEIKEKLDYLESIQDPDAIKNAVDDYLENNPIKVQETDPTVPDWAKQPNPPDVKVPDKLPNPYSITFTGAVNAGYDGSSPVEIKIPDSGGNVEPMEDDIPKVFFGGALPQTKDDTIMSFRYISKTKDISGYCKTKAQGNSSMSYPKKNQTVKLYKDAECTEKLMVDFKGWGPQNKFCFKANWVDLTHARNVVSARLWGNVVKSRANYAELPELLRTSPNQGAVDGFPVKVYAGGVYQGRYTLNIPKDAWMANMDDELDNHCILCGENYVSGCFRAEAKIDETDWTDEIHDVVPTSIKNRWNEVISFVMNSTDEEFVSNIGNYFDVESLIDYYIFGMVVCNNDGFGKNQLFFTYDGQKWLASVYDVENTFGTYLGYVLAHDFPRNRYEDYYASYETRYGNLLYIRLESLFTDAIKARYAELKNGALSLTNIINRFERFTDIAPAELVKEDYAATTADGAFADIPLKDESNIQQIRNYIVKRYSYVDSYIESLGTEPGLLYRLPNETTFDGVDDYLDTGVKLYDEAKDFTVVLDVTQGTNSNDTIKTVWGCTEYRSNGYKGARLCRYPYESNGFSLYSVPNNAANRSSLTVPDTERVKIITVFVGGILSSVQYKTASGATGSAGMLNTDKYAFTQHNENLILGAMKDIQYDMYIDHWNGTIHALEVWSKALTAEEIAEKLS